MDVLGEPRLSIIVLSYNRIEAMRDCLASVLALDYPDVEVVVVDNASANGAPDMIAREFPEVRLFRASRNLGICEGRNAAARLATGTYLWVLDNDVEIVDPQAGRRLVEMFEADPSLGIVGGEAAVDVTGRVVGTKNLRMTPNGMVRGRIILGRPAYELHDANMLEGCNMFMRRALVARLGGFDPGCELGSGRKAWDDNDFCYRAAKLGLRIAVVGRSPVVHHFEDTASNLAPFKKGRSRMYFVLKNYPAWQIALLPLLDLAFLLNPINLVRFVDKARRMAFGTRSNMTLRGESGSRIPKMSPDWRGALRRALSYAETLVAGYLYLAPVARAAFAARRMSPDSLARADMKALDGGGAPAQRLHMPRIDNG